jgi:hypothetical protein
VPKKPLSEMKLSEVLGGDIVRIKLLRDWVVNILNDIIVG